jgi:hypothetical protein
MRSSLIRPALPVLAFSVLWLAACDATDPNVEPCGDDCPDVGSTEGSVDGQVGAGGDDGGADGAGGAGGTSGDATSDGGPASPVDGGPGDSTATDGGDGGGGLDSDGGSDACGVCPSGLPHCAADGECVECLDGSHCDDGLLCADGTCAECGGHGDCPDPTLPRCQRGVCSPCNLGNHCEHIEGRPLCSDAGACVECTGDNYLACGTDPESGDPRVCDSLSGTCSEQTEQSAGLCQPCISDAQCQPGQLCVLQQRDDVDVGWFCLWQEGAGNGAPDDCAVMGRPYISRRTGTTSIDGNGGGDTVVCDLALTTCLGLNDFRQKDCAPSDTPDDSLCGHPDVDDSRCVQFSPTSHRCTTRCSSDDDCLDGHGCDTAASPRVCELDPT